MIGIDWVAVGLLAAAWAFSRFAPTPERIKLIVFAIACFAIAGLRARSGLAGTKLLFVGVSAGFGVMYLFRAFQQPKG
jgi:hypothetical protein